jgi:hypothetical protein
MDKRFKLIGEDKPPVLPPSKDEALLIDEYLSGEETIEWFRSELSKSLSIIANDPTAIRSSSEKIFSTLNAAIEGYISSIIVDLENWNLLSIQPCITARAIHANIKVVDFLHSQLCSTLTLIDTTSRTPLGRNTSLYDIMMAAILSTSDAILTSQRPYSPREIYEIARKNNIRASSAHPCTENTPPNYAFYQDNQSRRTSRALTSTHEDAEIVLAHVPGGEFNSFLLFCGDSINTMIEYSDYRLSKYHIERLKRAEFANFIYKREIKIYDEYITRIISTYDRKSYLSKIGFDHTNYSNLDQLEVCISNDLSNGGDRDSDQFEPNDGIGGAERAVQERLQELDRYAASFPGQPVSELVLQLFPEILVAAEPPVQLPTMAPEIWPEDRKEFDGQKETPPAFIKRVYGEWEGRGLTKKLIRGLDPALYRALYGWLQRGNVMPSDLDLPTISQQLDREYIQIAGEDGESHAAREALREAGRVRASILRRQGRQQE